VAISEQQRLLDILTERVHMRESLLNQGLQPRISIIDARESLANGLGRMAELRGNWVRAGLAARAGELDRQNILNKFINENYLAVAAAETRRQQVSEALSKATAKVMGAQLIAPISGAIEELAVSTIGQVVSVGQRLLVIVPKNSRLEAEVLIENRDIGVVKMGQPAVLKIESFPFERFGAIHGSIAKISSEAVLATSWQPTSGNSGDVGREVGALDRRSDYVFPAVIALDGPELNIRESRFRLLAGMNARVEIRVGKRRPIEYFLSPLRVVSSEAIREQ
jgi:hemolysin D